MARSLQFGGDSSPVSPDPRSSLATAALASATVSGGLLAGVFYAFQISVVRGLADVDDAAYVATFRAINRRILNPWFLTVFLGSGPLTLAAWALNRNATAPVRSLISSGLLLNGVMLAVTMAGNVPLNTALENGAGRARFERPWNRRNLVRTLAAAGSFAALALASGSRAHSAR